MIAKIQFYFYVVYRIHNEKSKYVKNDELLKICRKFKYTSK